MAVLSLGAGCGVFSLLCRCRGVEDLLIRQLCTAPAVCFHCCPVRQDAPCLGVGLQANYLCCWGSTYRSP